MPVTRESHGFTALRIEGGILPPEFLRTIASLDAPKQTGTDYGLFKSLEIKEELARYWRIANDLYSRYRECRDRNNSDAQRVGVNEWLTPLLRHVLCYEDLREIQSVSLQDRVFKLTNSACGDAVPLLLTTRGFSLDKSDPYFGHEGRKQSPHGLMQEYLNTEDACLWGIISNGSRLRILRDNVSLTRPSFIEADLDLIFDEELYSDFAALWLTIHSSRLTPAEENPSSCVIETWRSEAHKTGERVLENLRYGVTEALRQIGNGFLKHKDNTELRTALDNGTLSAEHYFQQLLRLIYRMLFLFTAEERNLLHPPEATDVQQEIFEDGYSISRLRKRALRHRHYDHHQDHWQGLQITFRALAQGAPALGLSALGGLFRFEQCPDLDGAAIANNYLLEAIRNLGFFRSDTVLAHVNYRDMDTEELGSVYESLLELQPVVDVNTIPWTFRFIGDEDNKKTKTKGSKRKLTGSYYTPPALVNELIKSTLEPVLAQAVADHPEDPRTAILDLKVIDPACGSGHFLLAAARRIAAEVIRVESGNDTSDETERQHALREVVRHCIYGVDRNPLAVELCKTALWIETVEPGKPLTFLDSHIRQGDSLIGILESEIMENGIPADAYNTLTGDDKTVCRNLKTQNRKDKRLVQRTLFDEDHSVAVATSDIENMPEETVDDVERKSSKWKTFLMNETHTQEELRSNLFVGAYFAEKTRETIDTVPITEDISNIRVITPRHSGVKDTADKLASRHSFFHWHLAFAEIMQQGGFDVVLGNPPWERIKLQEKEFFASRSPRIATAANKEARNQLIKQLNHDNALPAEKALFSKFETEKRRSEAGSLFIRTGGRFPLTGVGDVNTYAVFAETFLRLINERGRTGLIVPTGIATDDSTKAFFDEIVTKKRIVSLYDFENRKKIFPSVDSREKFCLLTLGDTENPSPQAEFAFFLQNTDEIKETERILSLSAEDFALFNPNTRTCPIFRTQRDMEIARKMYHRAGILLKEAKEGEPEINPWGIKFHTMFHMSNDSGLFRTRKQLESEGWHLTGNVFVRDQECYVPLYEAKLFHQYDHRFASFEDVPLKDIEKGKPRNMTSEEKTRFQKVSIPRYWVPEIEVLKRLDKCEIAAQSSDRQTDRQTDKQTLYSRRIGSQIALRRITRATDERTGVLAMIPYFGLSDSGITIFFGSLPSGISQAQQTSEHLSSLVYEEPQ